MNAAILVATISTVAISFKNPENGTWSWAAEGSADSEHWEYVDSYEVTGQSPLITFYQEPILDEDGSYRAVIYEDGPGADFDTNPYPMTIRQEEVTHTSVLRLRLARSGGAAIRIEKR